MLSHDEGRSAVKFSNNSFSSMICFVIAKYLKYSEVLAVTYKYGEYQEPLVGED